MKHLDRAAPITVERYRTKNDRFARAAWTVIGCAVFAFIILYSVTQ
jgi:hypothetical protein